MDDPGETHEPARRKARRSLGCCRHPASISVQATPRPGEQSEVCYSVYMTQVGMRELRHRLREYLGRVEAGERFEVTVFGRAVAQLQPISGAPQTLAKLIAEGRVTPPLEPDTSRLPALVQSTTGTTATEALLAERREDPR